MALREALEAAVNTAEEVTTPETPAVEAVTPVEKVEAVETPEQKAGRTAGRSRDEHGRLLPGKVEKPEPVIAKPVEPNPAEVVQRPQRPSSWKKEYWEHWDKLDPKVAEYIHQRENEFAKGVSTYKTDYDQVRPLKEVVAKYEPFLRQNNLRAEQAIDSLFQTDQLLRFGQPQDKLRVFAKLATDYQIPIHEMLVQGEDGKVYINQQYFQQDHAPQATGLTREEVQKMVRDQAVAAQVAEAVRKFVEAKDDKGNPKHPHFETVRQDMDGLLRLGKAKDLETAYSMAIRLHDDIWEAEQKTKVESALRAQQEAQTKVVSKAKAAAVSVKSATPANDIPAKGKGIRSHLESAIEAQNTGRV